MEEEVNASCVDKTPSNSSDKGDFSPEASN